MDQVNFLGGLRTIDEFWRPAPRGSEWIFFLGKVESSAQAAGVRIEESDFAAAFPAIYNSGNSMVRPCLEPHVKKIAVLRSSGIGDFIFALPSLEATRTAYLQAEIVLLGLNCTRNACGHVVSFVTDVSQEEVTPFALELTRQTQRVPGYLPAPKKKFTLQAKEA